LGYVLDEEHEGRYEHEDDLKLTDRRQRVVLVLVVRPCRRYDELREDGDEQADDDL
jgi:hypothetical protein